MSKRTITYLICLLIGFIIIFAGCFVVFDILIEDTAKIYDMQNSSFKEKAKLFYDTDCCLDAGGCWDNIRHRCEKKDQGFCVRNENDCIKRNGVWQEDKKYCYLKDK